MAIMLESGIAAKRLYAVEVTSTIMVMAYSPSDAERLVYERFFAEEVRQNGEQCIESSSIRSPRSVKDIPESWQASIPWNAPDDKTCRDYFANTGERQP